MLWGTASDHTTSWFDNAWYWLQQGGSGHLLSFNEPEVSNQANLSPTEAADAYRTYMQPFVGSAQLGSPAVSNDGYAWISEFMSACSDCHIDFMATHWYNDYTLFSDFQNWVNSICSLGNGRQVWITEVRYLALPPHPFSFSTGFTWTDACFSTLVRGLWHYRSAEHVFEPGYSMVG